MRQIYFLTFLFTISLSFSQNPGDIIITEIMQDPVAVSDTNGEYFELHNATGSDIDIDGWTIKDDGTNSHEIVNGGPLIVPAAGYLILGKNADMGTNGGVTVNYAFGGSFTLGNGADEIVLETALGDEIDRVNYDGGTLFPDPAGASMNLDSGKLNATDNDLGSSWCVSTIPFGAGDLGSPGSANESCPVLGIDDNRVVSFNMYPNPTSTGFVNIKARTNDDMSVVVYDILGKQVISQKVDSERLDVSNLDAGIYVMRISQNKNTVTKKLVIK